MKPLVAVVGSANLDLVFRCSELPRPGQTVLGHSFETHPGGKGANQAVAIGKLGGHVAFVGCVGDDGNGETLRHSLTGAGVDIQYLLTTANSPTGVAPIWVDDAGTNMIVVAPGANFDLSEEHVAFSLGFLQPSVVLAQLETELEAVRAASLFDRFILNPAPAQPLADELLANCFAITPNETEAEILTGIAPDDEASCLAASGRLLDNGVRNVVITLGSRGCYWATTEGGQHFDAPKVDAIDTTAAGDAFNGALAWYLASDLEFPEAIRRAIRVASVSTTRVGAQESMPTESEVDQFFA